MNEFKVAIRNSRYENITNLTVNADNWGSFHLKLNLKKDCPTGYYSIQVSSEMGSWSASFRVEDFKPAIAEMKIVVNKDKFVWGEPFEAKVIGWYLFARRLQTFRSL
jgi:uncharacterized protein YfaS (alpha-2-macroglobulin family)